MGRASAVRFASEGAHVVVSDIDENAAKAVVPEVEEAGGAATAIVCDVGDNDQIRSMIDQVARDFKVLHVLFNHAGIPGAAGLDIESADFEKLINVNQRSAFYALRRSTQHSITPDARVQLAPGDGAYYDAKTVHVNGARYPDTNGIDAARGAAVETRARAVLGEYERRARDVDAACCGVPRGAGDGPVLRRLRELGPVRGLVVGRAAL